MKKEEGNLSVSTENLLPIIKKWLYSEHDIFLRELISNAHDAVMKLKQLKMEGIFEGEEPEYCVEIIPDKEKKTLTIRDNGLGMTVDEIKKYINQIAFSGAKEFVAKYEKVKDQNNLIGHFGLGFYSSFMVADKVEIVSKSFQKDSQAVHWESDGSVKYVLEPVSKTEVGTDITLHILEDSKEYLETYRIKELIKKYSNFLPVKIKLENEVINKGEPLWKKNPADIKDEEYIEFYRELFPGEYEPLFWVHLKTDYPFELTGILYFPKLVHELDASKGNVKLFVNNVFVADKLKEVTPEFLSVIMGALDSPDIPLNVSRSQLQGDPRTKKISSHIVKKIAEKLESIYEDNREKYIQIWEEINTYIKFGCIQDTNFYENLKKAVLFKNLEKNWVGLEEYIERNKDKNINKDNKSLVLYLSEEKDNAGIEEILKENQIETLLTHSVIDSHFIDFLERQKTDIKFASADSDLNEIIFDSLYPFSEEKEKQMKEVFQKYIDDKNLEIQFKPFKSETMPSMLINPEAIRRMQEMTAMMMGKKNMGSFSKDILTINAKSSLAAKVMLYDSSDSEKAKKIVLNMKDLAYLSAGKLKGDALTGFMKRMVEDLNKG
ncbi:MAG: molecular chaperone HtpG [Spirochaetes bacterium GWB1_36_13]|nr:MAG: molecular chaperone HtpG [Spirochaetes bacterium GWB1_36_13]